MPVKKKKKKKACYLKHVALQYCLQSSICLSPRGKRVYYTSIFADWHEMQLCHANPGSLETCQTAAIAISLSLSPALSHNTQFFDQNMQYWSLITLLSLAHYCAQDWRRKNCKATMHKNTHINLMYTGSYDLLGLMHPLTYGYTG